VQHIAHTAEWARERHYVVVMEGFFFGYRVPSSKADSTCLCRMMFFSSGVNWRLSVIAIIHSGCLQQRLQLVYRVVKLISAAEVVDHFRHVSVLSIFSASPRRFANARRGARFCGRKMPMPPIGQLQYAATLCIYSGMRVVRFTGIFLLFTAFALSAASRTQARLILSAEAVRPGETVTAGLLLKMAPGWHTYWRNPGDSGAPTKIDWQLPDGIKAGEIQWPVPEKLTVADLTTYVYHDEVLLLVALTLADNIAAGPKELKAQVSWLECERVCLLGKGEVKASVLVGVKYKTSAEDFLFLIL